MSGLRTSAPFGKPWWFTGRWLLFILLMIGFAWCYVGAGTSTVNEAASRLLTPLEQRHLELTKISYADQHPDFSRSFSEPLNRLLPHRTDGFAQPVWPWIAAWMLDADRPNAAASLVRRLGSFRIAMTLTFLLVVGVACLRTFSFPAALLIPLIIGLHGLLPTLAEFSGVTLYAVLFLLVWPACIYGLHRNSLWVYGLIGLIGALAYLVDARALPVLVVFIVVSSLRAIWGWVVSFWPRDAGTTLWVRRNHVFGLLLLATMFGFIAGPRLVESHTVFGDAFYNGWGHLRWFDDAPSAAAWMDEHPMPTADRPSALEAAARDLNWGAYRSSHSDESIVHRLQDGMLQVGRVSLDHGGRYLIALFVLLIAIWTAVLVAAPQAHHAWHRLHPETATIVLFAGVALVVHVVIAAWDAAVMNIDSHLLPLQSAFALSLVWGCESLLRRARRRGARRFVFLTYQLALSALTGIAAWEAIARLQPPLSLP